MPKYVWQDTFLLDAYEYSRQGMSNLKIAKLLGVTHVTLNKWRKVRPAFRQALRRGRAYHQKTNTGDFRKYVYSRLPANLQELWTELHECELADSPVERVEALFEGRCEKTRMHLFLYAAVQNNFNVTKACAVVGIDRNKFHYWCTTQPDFSQLVDELQLAKKDFFEDALVQAIKDGSDRATVFANETINRDRGYNKKVEISHSGEIDHKHTHTISIKELDLPLDVRQAMLDSMRKQKQLTLDVSSEQIEEDEE